MEKIKAPQYEVLSYGKLRSSGRILPDKLKGALDYSPSFGWHECNDRYYVRREGQMEYLDDYLLIFTEDGEGVGVVDGVEHRLTRNTAMIFPRNRAHAYYVPEGGRWEFHWIHITGPACNALLSHIVSEYGIFFEITCREALGDYIESLLSTEYRYYEYELFMAQVISRILFTLIDGISTPQKDVQHRKALAFKVIDYIETHFQETLQLSDISAQIYLSTEHIIRIFHEETGMTPYQYIKQFRLRKACTYLEERELNVGEIAEAVGYHSISSFIAQFKAHYGITPGMYRKYCVSHMPLKRERNKSL